MMQVMAIREPESMAFSKPQLQGERLLLLYIQVHLKCLVNGKVFANNST